MFNSSSLPSSAGIQIVDAMVRLSSRLESLDHTDTSSNKTSLLAVLHQYVLYIFPLLRRLPTINRCVQLSLTPPNPYAVFVFFSSSRRLWQADTSEGPGSSTKAIWHRAVSPRLPPFNIATAPLGLWPNCFGRSYFNLKTTLAHKNHTRHLSRKLRDQHKLFLTFAMTSITVCVIITQITFFVNQQIQA